jgi:hypothetical protein
MPATKTDRNGAWGCCSPSIPRGIMAGAVSAAESRTLNEKEPGA